MADEFDIIHDYFAPLAADAPGAFGLTDDAAAIPANPGCEHIVTTDAIVAGVHFLEDETPANIAAKLVGSNLSDLAAMGARPVGFTLACAWPKGTEEATVAAFADGLRQWVEAYGFPLLGGDTVSTPGPAVFSLTALGEIEAGRALRRAGASPGETVFVTGTIGDGALGLLAAQGGLGALDAVYRSALERRYRVPEPRVVAGRALVGHARACLDVSDGLVQDLGHIAKASGVGIEIDADRVPLSDAAKAALAAEPSLIAQVLGGGDDYELAFTAAGTPADLGVPVTAVGRVVEGAGVRVLDSTGKPLDLNELGYRHFK